MYLRREVRGLLLLQRCRSCDCTHRQCHEKVFAAELHDVIWIAVEVTPGQLFHFCETTPSLLLCHNVPARRRERVSNNITRLLGMGLDF